MNIEIYYRNMKFEFEVRSDSCWYDLDHAKAVHKNYTMEINADREVYANLYFNSEKLEGYITDFESNSIPDNWPIDEKKYKFKKLKRPGYYL